MLEAGEAVAHKGQVELALAARQFARARARLQRELDDALEEALDLVATTIEAEAF